MTLKASTIQLCMGLLLAFSGSVACDGKWMNGNSHPMSIATAQRSAWESAAVNAGDARIGAVARRVPVRKRPSSTSTVLGYFTAGATLKRSVSVDSNAECNAGWYGVSPEGFVCLDEKTTIDLEHPTLKARGLMADATNTLPYPYAFARRQLELFEPDPQHQDGVRERGRLSKGSTFAVVGTWNTLDDYDQQRRLAMLTLGAFVPAKDLEPLRPSPQLGFELDPERDHLPVGLLVQPRPAKYRIVDDKPIAAGTIDATARVNLTSKMRNVEHERYWLLQGESDKYVAERDVFVVRQRLEFPDFVAPELHWMDVDSSAGIVVLYEGRTPRYVTRTIMPPSEPLPRGTTWIRTKQITDILSSSVPGKAPQDYDVPWVIELDNGVTLRGSLSQRADAPDEPIGKKAMSLELRPDDASRLFRFLSPSVPDGWHVVVAAEPRRSSSPVLLR
ncbi:MAG TPA: hypothetical protein VIV60_29430 [Polyangiaceae bacterium]